MPPEAVALPAWLVAVLALGSAVGAWKFLAGLVRSGARRDLEKVLRESFFTVEDGDGLGGRLKVVELKMSEHEGRVAALERTDETHNFQVAALTERQGKLEGQQQRTAERVDVLLGEVRERLSNIEGQLEIIVKRRDGA